MSTFCSILKFRINYANNDTSQVARLFGATSYASETFFTDEPMEQEEMTAARDSFTPLRICFESLPTNVFEDHSDNLNED